MTRKEMIALAMNCADAKTVGRMEIVLDHFKTCEDFLGADKGKLMAAYNAARPNGKLGLGIKFFRAMDDLRKIVREEELRIKAETRAIEMRRQQDEERRQIRFGSKELAAIATFMDAVEIKDVDLVGIRGFLDAVTK